MNLQLEGVVAYHPAARAGAAAALNGINLHLEASEQVAVIGPSGAGKTSLLQVLACALPPSGGTYRLNGVMPWQLTRSELQRLRGQLFLAPQVPPLPPRQRVVTAVLAARLPAMTLAASVRSLFYPSDIPGAYEALEQFDLAEKLFERVDRLSGGERQRVGLARALVAPAKMWLIDEPLSALDPTRANQAMRTLVEGARQRNVTLVATLHQVDMALAHFSRIIGMRAGEVAFDLPVGQVSRERLERLYEQHSAELRGEVPAGPVDIPSPPAPVVMHCR